MSTEDNKWMYEGMQTHRSMIGRSNQEIDVFHGVFGNWVNVLKSKSLWLKPCHTPQKIVYKSMAKARQAARAFNKDRRGRPPFWPYKCKCGKYHLTTKAK